MHILKKRGKSVYKIEAKNSELKHRHGYDVASSSGLIGMQMQGAMAIFAVNLKRILTLIKKQSKKKNTGKGDFSFKIE